MQNALHLLYIKIGKYHYCFKYIKRYLQYGGQEINIYIYIYIYICIYTHNGLSVGLMLSFKVKCINQRMLFFLEEWH